MIKHALIGAIYVAAGIAAALLLPHVGTAPHLAAVIGLFIAVAGFAIHVAISVLWLKDDLEQRLIDLEESNEDLQRTLGNYENELAQLHMRVESDAGARSEELVAEMRVLHGLLEKLEDQKVGGGEEIRGGRRRTDRPEESGEDFGDEEVTNIVRNALEANRIDLYLQPIVTLPSRKTVYYEAFSRIRNEVGTVVYPRQYLHLAEREGLISLLDNLLMFRCVQVVRQSQTRHPDRQFFVNISAATLSDENFIVQFMEFIEDNPELVERIILEIPQSDVKGMDRIIESRLQALAAANFSFSMDHVTDMDIDFHGLSLKGFKFIKVGAPVFFGTQGPLHRADYNAAVKRNGLRLILEKIEDDATLVELLDLDVEMGQGYLFGAPRRSEVDEGKALA